MTVPVPLTDIEAAAGEATPGPWTTPDVSAVWGGDGWVLTDASYEDAAHIAAADPPTVLALCDALRIAVEALHEVAVDHEPMPVNDGRDWCSKCQNYMRGDSGCTAADATAALAAVRELVDLGESQ